MSGIGISIDMGHILEELKKTNQNVITLNKTISKSNNVATKLTFVLIGIGVVQLLTTALQLIYK